MLKHAHFAELYHITLHTASQKSYVDISIKGLFEASTDKQAREWTSHGSLLHFKSFYSSSSKVIG
jgi:hypothetical protein